MATVFDRALRADDATGFDMSSRDDEEGVLRLVRREEKGGILDELCRYPIVNYYSWRPTNSYAESQTSAIGRRRPGESIAQAGRLDGIIYLAILGRGEGHFEIQSLCSANLHDWGLVEAGSRGVAEKEFLEEFLALMGALVEVPLPEPAVLEPSRSDPTRDLHVADGCQKRCVGGGRCSGMYVDPDSLELRCVKEEKGRGR
jgi:hypothetical protein